MTTVSSSSYQFQGGSYFRRDEFPGETSHSQPAAEIGYYKFLKDAIYEEDSEQEFDSEQVLEGGGAVNKNSIQNQNNDSNLIYELQHSDFTPSSYKTTCHKRRIFSRPQIGVWTALDELRLRLENGLQQNSFLKRVAVQSLKDITLWGVPLLPSKRHEETNTILLKFLKAQNYRVPEALEMLRQTLIWREKQRIDHILEEKFEEEMESELSKVVFTDSVDKDGHPLCFSLYGPVNVKDHELLYSKGKEETLRWKIQFVEKNIKKRLSFKEGGVSSFVFITDMKNAPGSRTRMNDLSSLVSKDVVSVFQRHYPDLIFKHIVINTPLWYYLYHGMHASRNKFVFGMRHRAVETLLKYIPPENIPIRYGGLRSINDEEFSAEDGPPQELNLGARAVTTYKIPVSEGKVSRTIVWEVMVVGWDVSYKDEFVPYDEGSYKIMLMKKKRMNMNVRHSFYVNEPGSIVITITNPTYVNKRAFIRHKAKLTLPLYMLSTH